MNHPNHQQLQQICLCKSLPGGYMLPKHLRPSATVSTVNMTPATCCWHFHPENENADGNHAFVALFKFVFPLARL